MEHTYELIRMAQKGNQDAMRQLLEENEKLIWSIVRRFSGRGEAEDLFQIGAIGLMKCIEKFDFSYDVKFSTYAVPMILGEIRRFLRDDGLVKVSRSLKELAYRAKRIQEQIWKEEEREVTIAELAKALEADTEDILLALDAGKEVESLYAATGGEDSPQLIEKLGSQEENEKVLERLYLQEALERLEPKERQIITMRYFQDKTQTDVAKSIGISQVQVSRIEKRILQQMRKAMQ